MTSVSDIALSLAAWNKMGSRRKYRQPGLYFRGYYFEINCCKRSRVLVDFFPRRETMKLIIAFSLFVVLTGVAQATQVTNNVPDAGSTSVLAGMALGGIAFIKRLIR
jgi:hypothetical protein